MNVHFGMLGLWLKRPLNPMFEAQVSRLNLFKPTLELPRIERRDALLFEEGAPTVRKRRPYLHWKGLSNKVKHQVAEVARE